MKKRIAALILVALLCIASSAMAARVKVPKTLCLDWDSSPGYPQQLSLKAMGSIPDAVAKKIKTYGITGYDFNGWNGPVSGSAYVIPGTSILHASYSGMSGGGYARDVFIYELHFDLAEGTGTMQYIINSPDGTSDDDGSDTVFGTDCKSLSITTARVSSPASSRMGVRRPAANNAAVRD